MLIITSLLCLWPAASVACQLTPRAENEVVTPTNSTGNGTVPIDDADDTPWIPTCKLPADKRASLSMGFITSNECVAGHGTLRGYMIFVDFPDAESPQDETPEELYNFLVPEAAEWYKNASYGALNLDIKADFSRFYRMPYPAASYEWDTNFTWNQLRLYIADTITTYTKNGTGPAPPEADVLYIVPTRNASTWMTRSQAFGNAWVTNEGEFVAKKTVAFGTDPFTNWGFKTLNHETGHAMCLPDYYPLTGNLWTGYYVGGYSAMGDLGGIAPDFFAWDKWRLGWISDDAVDCVLDSGTTEHTLTPLGVTGGTKAVVIAANKTSAVVAEVRTVSALDTRVCAPGVLLYSIDTRVETGSGPLHILDANPNSGGCGVNNYDELNDGTLSLDGGASSIKLEEWGLDVTLVEHQGDNYRIRVNYS